jgi:hypothetical protein
MDSCSVSTKAAQESLIMSISTVFVWLLGIVYAVSGYILLASDHTISLIKKMGTPA